MRHVRLALVGLAVAAATLAAADPKKSAPSHEAATSFAVKGATAGHKLQTLCLDADGHVVGLVAADRYGPKAKTSAGSEVLVYDADGTKLRGWKVAFAGQAVNVGPDGCVYVGGEGRIAKYDAEGKELANVDLPHVGKVLSDKDALLEKAKETLAENIQSYEDQVKEAQGGVDALTKKLDAGDLTAAEKTRLAQQRAMVKAYQQMLTQEKKRTPEEAMKQIGDRLRGVNGVTVTAKDVFVVGGSLKGYGYTVWRMDHKFENPKAVLKDLGGCCGQMDVQASGDELFVAENTRHRVGHYDRDGKKLGDFGKSGRGNSDPECFGGCCNPMNVRVGSAGVYTAESEGIVKLFGPSGEFRGVVGSLKVKEGCKNVAVAATADGSKVFFCDVNASKVHVLARKSAAE